MVGGQGSYIMVDFDRARQVMVDGQLRAGGVTDERLLAQMSRLPRELFVPEQRRSLAYLDDLHWLGEPGSRRFMPAPATLAKLLKLAEVAADDTVLDLGAGTGYATAILAGLAATVIGLEQDAALAASASANLAALGIDNASVVTGTVDQFGPARFDVIIAQGMLDSIPAAFFDVLKDGGRIVALVRTGPVGLATVFTKSGGHVAARREFNASLPPLFGVLRDEEFIF